MDAIAIRNIRVMGRHGANPGERDTEQPFDLDVVLEVDLTQAKTSDALDDTVNYDTLYHRIKDVVRTTSFVLLERLAGELFSAIFEDGRIARATVTIAKPMLLEGATPSVSLTRENPRFGAP